MPDLFNLGGFARIEIDFDAAFAARLAATIEALIEPPAAADIERMRNLLFDLEAIRAGEEPSSDRLLAAPLLSNWRLALAPDGLRLIGKVSGHPYLGARPRVLTSPVFAVDREFDWARTLSRFYRLGPSSAGPSAKRPRSALH